MRLLSRLILSATLLLTCCMARVSRAGVIIDDFRSGDITVSRTGDTVAEATQTGLSSSVVGGGRFIKVGEFGSAGQTLSIDASSGTMEFETGDSHGYFSVVYGSEGEPLNLDLLAEGAGAIVLDTINTSSSTGQPLRLSVFTTGDEGTVTSRLFAEAPQTLQNGLSRLTFSFEFISPEADFRRVERIELSAGRVRPLTSLTIHHFATIPEPTTYSLMLVGSLLLIGRRPSSANVPLPNATL